MNNIISKVAASVLLAGIVVSGINAKSNLYVDGNISKDQNKKFPIDLVDDKSANLTFVPKVNAAPGSGFTLNFENGGYKEVASIFLCARSDGNTSKIATDNNMSVVGNMFSQGTIVNHVMKNPKFQFKNNAEEKLIAAGTHIYFRTDDTCKKVPTIVGLGSSCQTLSAQVVDGVTTQGTAYPDYNTKEMVLGKTIKAIKIACRAPVCSIDATKEMKVFTSNSTTPTGINGNIQDNPLGTAGKINSCPDCSDSINCVTTIDVNNSSSHTIESLKFVANLYNSKGEVINSSLKLKSAEIKVEDNKTVADYTIDGSVVTLKNVNLSSNSLSHIKVTLIPNETDVLPAGTLKARIYDLDTNQSTSKIDVTYDEVKSLATLQVSGLTTFTVPYMNTNYRTFVKITTKSTDAAAKLSAVITDQNGKSTEVELNDIPAKGTVYLFSDHGPLYDAAQAAGLANAWTVKFTTSAAAIVDSYMKSPNGGDRRVEAFD